MCGPKQTQRKDRVQQFVPIMDQEIEYIEDYTAYQFNKTWQQVGGHKMTEVNNFQELEHRLQRLPENPMAPNAQAQNENLSYKKRKKLEKERKEQYAQAGKVNRILGMEEIKRLSMFDTAESREKWKQEKVPRSDRTREQTMRDVLEYRDYSNFENLDLVMRNVVASSALSKFIKNYRVSEQSDPKALCNDIRKYDGVTGLLDPALRLGFSLAQNTASIPEKVRTLFRELDELMSTAVMEETLKSSNVADARIKTKRLQNYFENKGETKEDAKHKADKAMQHHRAQQIQIAKRLMLMQLSDFKKITEDGASHKWDKSMAVALSHCSRVVLTLPKQEGDMTKNSAQQHRDMWSRIMTIDGENYAQDNKRGGSTHSVKRRKVSDGPGGSKEKKVIVNAIGQRGMNCAIGGVGEYGISGKVLCNDGSCGHFYSMYKEADTKHYGTMLMGLESDANGVTNQMGHTHDMHATPEKASSLGGQRVDEVGKKYGGRQCDLTAYSAKDIEVWMERLEWFMQNAQSHFYGYAGPNAMGYKEYEQKYTKLMGYLCGKSMDAGQWAFVRETLGIPEGTMVKGV